MLKLFISTKIIWLDLCLPLYIASARGDSIQNFSCLQSTQLSLVAFGMLKCYQLFNVFLCPIIAHVNNFNQLVKEKALICGTVLFYDLYVAKTNEYFLVLILIDFSLAFTTAVQSLLETLSSPSLHECSSVSLPSASYSFPVSSLFADFQTMQSPRALSLAFLCPNSHLVLCIEIQ